MTVSFTTPCGFFIVVGRPAGGGVKVNTYWQDKPVDLNRFELSLAGARMLGNALIDITKDAPDAS